MNALLRHAWGESAAADQIMALVSGFPDDHGRLRNFLMLQAYVDPSGKGDPDFLVLAGYIATAEVWAAFSKKWQLQLNEAGLPYFKMNEMAGRPEIAGWFYRVLEDFEIKAAISCVVHTKELVKVVRVIRWPAYITEIEGLENPYYFGFKAITDILAQYSPKMGISEPVDFIFDEESEKIRIPEAWELIRKNCDPEVLPLLGDQPIYRDDKKAMPLQAADLYAWWGLKWEREGRDKWERDLPFPWTLKKSIPRLAMHFRERDFWIEFSKGLARFARTQEEFAYAMSIFPADPDEPAEEE